MNLSKQIFLTMKKGPSLNFLTMCMGNRGFITMKSIVFSLIVAPAVALAMGRDLTLYNAQRYGAEAKIILCVIDQDGHPVADAKIFGGFQTGGNINDNVLIRGITDTNGEYMVQGKCTSRVRCGISKDGYYESEYLIEYPDGDAEKPVENGKWMPYGEVANMTLKKIVNPCRLASDDGSCKKLPELGEWIGYDLELNQWVAPYGSGRCPDMLVRIDIDAVNDTSDFKTSMEVSFTNNPYAGAYKLSKDAYSEMYSVYNADTNAEYQSSFLFVHERHPVVRQKPVVHVEGMTENDTRLDAKSYLVFRTRTEVDEKGKLVSAHYGKIEGLWEFFGSMRAASIQFNPTPNDTNLEDANTAEYSRMRQRQREELPCQKR